MKQRWRPSLPGSFWAEQPVLKSWPGPEVPKEAPLRTPEYPQACDMREGCRLPGLACGAAGAGWVHQTLNSATLGEK